MSALGKMVWPDETTGRKRGRIETAVSTPDAWNAQQGEHAKMATARHAAYCLVRAIGRLYPNLTRTAQSSDIANRGICTSRAMELAACSSDNLIDTCGCS